MKHAPFLNLGLMLIAAGSLLALFSHFKIFGLIYLAIGITFIVIKMRWAMKNKDELWKDDR